MKKIFTQKEIQKVAKEILKKIPAANYSDKATVVALSGDLGAGKTTLTQAIARELGITENIISPTFVLMKSYALSNEARLNDKVGQAKKLMKLTQLIHLDAYRLDSAEELLKLGWNDLIADPKNLILIEWPERVEKIIPKDAIWIELSHKDEHTREILMK